MLYIYMYLCIVFVFWISICSFQILKSTWKKTGEEELANVNINTRQNRASQITLFRANELDQTEISKLSNLACHSKSTQDRNYNYSNNVINLIEAKEKLKNLMQISSTKKIENWQMQVVLYVLYILSTSSIFIN